MVALVVLMLSMMGILNAMVIAMQQNLEIYSRDEAVRIAEQEMNKARNQDFETLANETFTEDRAYKQHTRHFTVNRTVTFLSTNSCAVQLRVGWTINRKDHAHSITSIVSRGT
jgi:Tfp pilus assembly protein PilV